MKILIEDFNRLCLKTSFYLISDLVTPTFLLLVTSQCM